MQNPSARLIDRADALTDDNSVFRSFILTDQVTENIAEGSYYFSGLHFLRHLGINGEDAPGIGVKPIGMPADDGRSFRLFFLRSSVRRGATTSAISPAEKPKDLSVSKRLVCTWNAAVAVFAPVRSVSSNVRAACEVLAMTASFCRLPYEVCAFGANFKNKPIYSLAACCYGSAMKKRIITAFAIRITGPVPA